MNRSATPLVLVVVLLGLLATAAPAHDHHPKQAGPQNPQEPEAKAVSIKLPDVELLDQDGKRLKFKTDVVKDRLVVIDTIYTTCPVICPILSATFANVQQSLGDRLGKEVFLISISVDPTTDVPPRLKAYAERWEARPGWIFLTGQKNSVDRVLQGLGVYSADYTVHPPSILVGDGRRGEWTRFYGFATPELILGKVEQLRNGRMAKSHEGVPGIVGHPR